MPGPPRRIALESFLIAGRQMHDFPTPPRMVEPLEIKHRQPALRQMLADYRIMFSGAHVKVIVWWCAVLLVLTIVFFLTLCSLGASANIVLRVIAFLDSFILFGFAGLFALSLLSPISCAFYLSLDHCTARAGQSALITCSVHD